MLIHSNILADKGFNFSDEFTAKYVHLSPQEEEYTSSDSIANP